MKTKFYFFAVVAFALGVFCLNDQRLVRADDSDNTRETIRCQLIYIAKNMDGVKRRSMMSNYGAVAGNVQKGNYGWGYDPNSLQAAINRSLRECEKNGGGCEELFTIGVFNDTPYTIKIYLYHPWETDYSESNALWSWTWQPGQGNNLGIENYLLFVPKRFFLRAEYIDKSRSWNTRRIGDFGYKQRNYRDGQNLKLHLTP